VAAKPSGQHVLAPGALVDCPVGGRSGWVQLPDWRVLDQSPAAGCGAVGNWPGRGPLVSRTARRL